MASPHPGAYLRTTPAPSPTPSSLRIRTTPSALDSSLSDRIQAGREALARGRWDEARACFEDALRDVESAEALEGLGMACWWLEDYSTGMESRERAYRLYRVRDDRPAAARVAIWLSNDYADFRGETAVANGWLRRAERLLDGLAATPEHAVLAYQNAHVALMTNRDPVAARRLSAEAAEIARKVGPPDMEMLGVALEGLALVTEGQVAAGMSCLDEATAAAMAGELSDPAAIGTACCYLIRACEQVHDYDRAAQWCERVREFCRRWQFTHLFNACRIQYASLLTLRGDWEGAESEIEALRHHAEKVQPRVVPVALARLADLRRRQGRWEEAERLYAESGAHLLAVLGRAGRERDHLRVHRGRAAAGSVPAAAKSGLGDFPVRSVVRHRVVTLSEARGPKPHSASPLRSPAPFPAVFRPLRFAPGDKRGRNRP